MKWSARVVMHMDVKSGQLGEMVCPGSDAYGCKVRSAR